MDQFRARTKDAPFWLLSEKLSPGTTALSSMAALTTLSRLLIVYFGSTKIIDLNDPTAS